MTDDNIRELSGAVNPEYGPSGFDDLLQAESTVGQMTYGIRDNAKDVCDIWMKNPMRRHEFGAREIFDLREAVYGLKALLDEYDRRNSPTLVYKR